MSDHSELVQRVTEVQEELNRLRKLVLGDREQVDATELPPTGVLLSVADYRVALDVRQVEEVLPMVMVSPLPQAPAAVRGTLNYRGQLVAVLDLPYAMTGVRRSLTPNMFVVITQAAGRPVALVVDSVLGVEELSGEESGKAGPSASLPAFVRRVLQHEARPLLLLEPGALLAAGELDMVRELLAEVDLDAGGQRERG